MNVYQIYKEKLRSPQDAVKIIKSGDWIDYATSLGFPVILDEALAERKEELHNVKIRGNLIFGPIRAVECDPEREHFVYNSWHFSDYERRLSDRGLCNYIPMIFRSVGTWYRHFLDVDVAMIAVTPMDKHGYFNLSSSTGVAMEILRKAKKIIVEVNENLPWINGGFDEVIHISDIDFVVEGEHGTLPEVPEEPVKEADMKIAEFIMPHIPQEATLQLGIGAIPSSIGTLLVDSDLRDLGMHTELCSDSYVDLFEAGKLTNQKKTLHRGKGITGIAFGTKRLYEWIDKNPGVTIAPLEYVNDPENIAKLDNMISINSCISVDLYGQICAESAGLRHISGTGGQLDYVTGAVMAKGGKSFICMNSYHTDKEGNKKSCILPQFMGDIVTSPRSQAHFIATEYGCVNLAGCSTWERTERLISVAHPDFRDDLIKAAEKQKIWLPSNKR